MSCHGVYLGLKILLNIFVINLRYNNARIQKIFPGGGGGGVQGIFRFAGGGGGQSHIFGNLTM